MARRDRITTAHFCPNCGKPVPEASRFCTECGLALPEAPGAEPAAGASAAATPPPPAPATTSATPAAPVSTAPSAPPPRPPAAPPVAPPAGQGSNRTLLVVGLVVVLLAAAGGIGWLVFGGDDDGGGDDEAGEVFLEPVNVTVADPFGGNFDVHNVRATATTAPRIATTAPPSTATATTTATATATRSVAGAWPGLYGGTRNASTCDRDQLVAFLEANPDKARAWAGVLGVRTADIETYVDGLTPVLLQRDTRVTNHGFRNGRATPTQSILQAGTAVLVDEYGVPRVKCNCGNPLLEPQALRSRPRYTGTRWPTFSPANVLVVNADVQVSIFILVDVDGGEPIRRPAGTKGEEDEEVLVDDLCDLYPELPGCAEVIAAATTTTTRPGEPELGTGDVQMTLRWSSTADLDLSVVDPTGAQIDYANPTSPSGGQLDVDSNFDCATASATGVENVFWPTGAAPDGEYVITVTYFDVCEPAGTGPQAYELTVLVNGSAATLRPAAFRPDPGTGGWEAEYRIALDDGTAREVVPVGAQVRTETGTVQPGGSLSYRADKGPGFQATSTTTT
nr:zinc-ribbon domain-containing protein [Acidimicrobiales bacterium]